MNFWPLADPGLDTVIILTARAAVARRVVWGVGVAVVALAYSPLFALPWLAAVLMIEAVLHWTALPFLRGDPPTRELRMVGLVATLAAMALGCAGQILFWCMDDGALRLVATAFIFMLLIHAQIFMSPSTSGLLLSSAMPIATLLVEIIAFGGYRGLPGVIVPGCAAMGMAYAVAGGFINQNARRAQVRATSEAEEANAAKSAFLAMMSHELRTPMNGVLGMAHALKQTGLDAVQSEHVNLMIESGEGLMSILGDILDISKIEAGRLDLDPTPSDLSELCMATAAIWSSAASAKNVELTCEIDPATPPWVLADTTRLRQVTTNLISNAVKFTESGRVVLSLRCTPAAKEELVGLQFSVSDTGIGLTPSQIDKLFKPFTQAEASTTRRFGGTGLGLSICKRLVELMGGVIHAESREGVGSTFTVQLELPVCSAPAAATGDREVRDIGGLRILVVDDNPANRTVAGAILGAVGAMIECAGDGATGLDALRCTAFDMVLMDIHMPVMDGREALRRIRAGEAGQANIPVIALTADAMQGEATRLLALGFDGVQAKPINPAGLIGAIAELALRKPGIVAPTALAG